MNRPELYRKAVDVLIRAYENGTLEHGDCASCAVGNLCASLTNQPFLNRNAWSHTFLTDTYTGEQIIQPLGNNIFADTGRVAIAFTGYTVDEMAAIEFAFETSIRDIPLNKDQEESVDRHISILSLKDCNAEMVPKSYVYYTVFDKESGQYIGLSAVIKALKKIHGVSGSTDLGKLKGIAISKGVKVEEYA